MLDFNRGIKSQSWKFLVYSAHYAKSMGWSIPEIGVPKGDMLCPVLNLSTNIGEDNISRDSEKTTTINGRNWTMLASMFTATRCLGIACESTIPIPLQMGIRCKFW